MPTTNVVPGSHEELEQIARSISKSRKVVVITGAGISTNLGIPDFRSDNGLYSLIQEQYNKFNDNLEKRNTPETEQDGPRKRRKRRKLDRSQSLGSSETLNNGDCDLTILRRSLRSAKSSLGFEDAPSANDEEPQESTIRASRYGSPSDIPTSLPEIPKNILSNVKGRDLFDAVIWQDKKSTETHYTFITSLKHKIDEVKDTSEVHKFIRVLRDGGKLVRNYTQNIDMLEAREGLCTDMTRGTGSRGRFNPKLRKEARAGNDHEGGIFDSGVEVVQLHGNLERLRCQLCLALTDWETDDRHLSLLAGKAPPCPKCVEKTEKRIENNRRGLSVGTLRPDIVLYGESNPHEQVIGDLSTHDIMLGPDMLIILGTSLKVHGLKLLLKEFAKAVHTKGGTVVFVNNTKPPDSIWGDVIDFWVEWDCDEWVRDVKARREDIWMPWGTSREPSPKPSGSQGSQISATGPVVVPKNPQSMRTDFNCAAYQWDKILRALREKSGRADCPEEIERRAHAERTNAARAADGKAFTAKLVAEAARSRPVAKQPAAAQKPAPKLALVVKTPPPAHVPPLHIARLPEYASWKPPSRQPKNQYLPPSPIQIAADRPATRKRKREPRPGAVREDKNNNAHHQWETIKLINKTSGSQRVLPEMATARQTFYQENRRAGSGIMEMPPPARPTTPRMTLKVSPVVPNQTLPAPVPSSPLITFKPPSPVVSNSVTPTFAPASKPSPKIRFKVPSPVVSNAAIPAPMPISQQWPRRISRESPPLAFMPITPASVPYSAPSSSNVITMASLTGTMQMTSNTPIPPPKRKRTCALDARPRSVPSPVDNTDGLDNNWAISVANFPFGHPSHLSRRTQAPHLQPSHTSMADPALEARRQYIHARGDPCLRGIHSIYDISEWQDPVTLCAWDDPERAVASERGQKSVEGRPAWDAPTPSPAFPDRGQKTAGQGDHYVIPYDLGRAEMFRDAEQSQNTPSDGSVQTLAPCKPLHFPEPTFTPEVQMEVVGPRIRAEHKGPRHDWSGHKYATSILTDSWDAEWGTQRPRLRPFEQLPTPAMTPQTSTMDNGVCNGGGATRSWNSWSYTPAPSATFSYPTPANSQESMSGSGSSDRDSPQLPSFKFGPPMTPKTRRIKNLGSISSILSSPPPAPPTLSKESETLLEISDPSPPRYPPPYADDQQKLWPGYPDLDKRLTKRDRRMMRRN